MLNIPGKTTSSLDVIQYVTEPMIAWQIEGTPVGPPRQPDPYWSGFFFRSILGFDPEPYLIDALGIDPFIDSFKSFFQNIWDWIVNKWNQLWSWTHEISTYIESLWNSLGVVLSDLYHWIGDKIEGIYNLIGNWAGILWEWLISDIWSLVDYVITPLREVWDYLVSILSTTLERIHGAISSFITDPLQWVFDLGGELWTVVEYLAGQIWDSLVSTTGNIAYWIGDKIIELAPLLVEYLRDALYWLWEQIKIAYFFVKDQIIPAVYEATSGALGYLKDEFTNIMGLAYDEILGYAKSYVPMTPEKSVELGAIMFGSAVGLGALAHGIALSIEAIPNLKYMGVHYLSAFAARMGSFGAVSAATMGVIAAVSLRTPFSYYMKSLVRPTWPRAGDLMMMAVKPDIPLDTFKRGMTYEGYSDYWIDAFQRTMYHEPRYFELSMMAEDAAATPEWLFTKARRSGYSEADSVIFVSSIAKKAARTQRQDYYKQAFNLFKEGYIDQDTFEGYLDTLEMRPEAKEFAVTTALFAYRFDYMKELIGAYQLAYRNDLITESEFTGSLAALGLQKERVESLAYVEWVRKTPSAVKKERREAEKQWAEIQKEYSRVYIEAFQKGLIDEGQLVAYLEALGIKEEVAIATARYEAFNLLPKPKFPEIYPPSLPAPPGPPEYEE